MEWKDCKHKYFIDYFPGGVDPKEIDLMDWYVERQDNPECDEVTTHHGDEIHHTIQDNSENTVLGSDMEIIDRFILNEN